MSRYFICVIRNGNRAMGYRLNILRIRFKIGLIITDFSIFFLYATMAEGVLLCAPQVNNDSIVPFKYWFSPFFSSHFKWRRRIVPFSTTAYILI